MIHLLRVVSPIIGYLCLCGILVYPAAGQTTRVVTTVNDNGAGSLRQVILDAADGDRIAFDSGLQGQGISLTSGSILVDKDVEIIGPGSERMTLMATGAFRVLEFAPDITASISGIQITGGNVTGNGGGIWVGDRTVLTVLRVSVTGNEATDNGGGMYISPGAAVAVDSSLISRNKASGDLSPNGGGIYNASGTVLIENTIIEKNESDRGGGVWNTSNAVMAISTSWISENIAAVEGGGIYNNSKLTLERSTVSGNRAEVEAGGIRNRSGDTLTVSNSTISSNSAPITGGIVNFMGSTIRIYNSTIFGNASDESGAGMWNMENAEITLYSSIVAANIRGGNTNADMLDDAAGIRSEGFNWIGARTTFQALPTDRVGTPSMPLNPRLKPLVGFDDEWPSHVPEQNSLVIDQGDCSRSTFDVDQRGAPRVVDIATATNAADGCDIGATELSFLVFTETEDVDELPVSHEISPVYPNPFSSTATFTVAVPYNQHVNITLYDVLGKQVLVLHEGLLRTGGAHAFEIDASALPAGFYFYRVQGASFTESRSAIVVR